MLCMHILVNNVVLFVILWTLYDELIVIDLFHLIPTYLPTYLPVPCQPARKDFHIHPYLNIHHIKLARERPHSDRSTPTTYVRTCIIQLGRCSRSQV